MTTTTDTKTETYGLDHDSLMAVHRKHQGNWKWCVVGKITEHYQIGPGDLEGFRRHYGLPCLRPSGNRPRLYSLPALEAILETLPDLHEITD